MDRSARTSRRSCDRRRWRQSWGNRLALALMAWLMVLGLGGALAAPPRVAAPRSPLAPSPLPPPGPIILGQSPADSPEQLFLRGQAHFQRNQLERAETDWRQALQGYGQAGDLVGQLQVWEALGLLYRRRGDGALARATFEQLLNQAEAIDDRPRQANALGNLASLDRQAGQYLQALERYQQALALYQDLGDAQRQGQVLTNLGNVQADLGQYELAQGFYQRSLALALETGDGLGRLRLLNSLGLVAARQGRYAEAENAYYKALVLARRGALGRSDPQTEATLLYNLGSLDHAQQRFAKAQGYYQQGLDLAPQAPDLASSLRSGMALIALERGQVEAAIALLQEGLAVLEANPIPARRSRLLLNLGYVHWRAGQIAQAEQVLFGAIAEQEALRQQFTANDSATDLDRVSLLDTQRQAYSLLQQVLVAQGRTDEALLVAERGRAQAFATLLASQQEPGGLTHPEPPPLTLAAVRQLARSRQVTLVEYSVIPDETFVAQGKLQGQPKTIYVWVVQPSGQIHFRAIDLAPLESQGLGLADLLRSARCFDPGPLCRRLAAQTRGIVFQAPTGEALGGLAPPGAAAGQDEGTDARPVYPALQQFYQLLIAPIAGLLPESPDRPVVILADDLLHLLPFAALQSGPLPQAGPPEFLIERHSLLNAPSLQVLLMATDAEASQPADLAPWRDQTLLVGNPTMPSLQLNPNRPAQPLAPLPGAEREVRAIAQRLGQSALTGAAATERQVTQRLPQARWVHLATHGLLDYGIAQRAGAQAASPRLPGAIALAPDIVPAEPLSQAGVDNPGDGLLTATEIIQLRLQAELVVLSACDTGRGEITGDGVVGLSRAWLGAGAKGVVVSLWAVPDDATALLMTAFYDRLLAGESQAEALRLAMVETRSHFPNPQQWAAFNLMGSPPSPAARSAARNGTLMQSPG